MKIAYSNALFGHNISPGRVDTYGKAMSRPPARWLGAAASRRIALATL